MGGARSPAATVVLVVTVLVVEVVVLVEVVVPAAWASAATVLSSTMVGARLSAALVVLVVLMMVLVVPVGWASARSEEHTSELQSLMRISYAVFCLKKKKKQ